MTDSTLTTRRRSPFRIKVEPRLDEPSAWYPAAVSFGAIVIALILGGIVIAVAGGRDKLAAVRGALAGGFMNVLVTDESLAALLVAR